MDTSATLRPEPFPPQVLREYSVLADGERAALLGPRGDVVWMCAPGWADDAVFSSLIGGSGIYAVTPADPRSVWGGRYEESSLIWRGRWVTSKGIVESRDALAFPGDDGTAVLLRSVVAVSGDAQTDVRLPPVAGFGRHPMEKVERSGEVWTAQSGRLYLRWSGARGPCRSGRVVAAEAARARGRAPRPCFGDLGRAVHW